MRFLGVFGSRAPLSALSTLFTLSALLVAAPGATNAQSVIDRTSGKAPVPSARWEWPLAGRPRVIRGFAPPARPWLTGHRGVDLAATPGAEIRAAGAGTIGYAGPLAERGVVTVLHSNGLRTTYLPAQPSVRRGQPVSRGEVIGVVQDVPGHCPAACLHWGLLRDHRYLDPLLLLGHGQVRLLPLWPVTSLARPTEPLRPPGES
ncbi:M23 family metallopeptidase [Streptosporangium sp. NPDC000396]|uniref:M23 family metallopeptidase n=1 Tax=Streptosporangium sp. NPDC000396 TaxID=3366185 RepID=UPI0036D14F9A